METVQLTVGNRTYLFAARAMEWEEQDLSDLTESIKAMGVIEPIVYAWIDAGIGNGTREKVYLDGRRRLFAAHAAQLADFDVEVPEREHTGDMSDEALIALIDDLNSKAVESARGARKRTGAVVAMMGASLAKHRPAARARMAEGGKSKGAPRGAPLANRRTKSKPRRASEAVAAETGTSARTVERVAAVEAKGAPELVEAVRRGAIAVKSAERVAKRPEQEQRAIVSMVREGLPLGHAERVATLPERGRKIVVDLFTGGTPIDAAIEAATASGEECDLAWIDVVDGSNGSIDSARAAIVRSAGTLTDDALVVAFCGAAGFVEVRHLVKSALSTRGEVMPSPIVWLRDGARSSSWCADGEGHELIVVARMRGCSRRLECSAVVRGESPEEIVGALARAWSAKAARGLRAA